MFTNREEKVSIYSAKLIDIHSLLGGNILENGSSGNVKYIIPRYQRGFVWDIGDVENLINDIKESFDNGEKDYFLGEVVLSQGTLEKLDEDNWDLYNIYDVIDGQQRLTTILILLAVMYNYLLSNKKEIVQETKKDEKWADDLSKTIKDHIERKFLLKDNGIKFAESYVVERVDDLRECYKNILSNLLSITYNQENTNSISTEDSNCKKLVEIENYIREKIFSMDVKDFEGFLLHLLFRTKVVVTITKDIETGYRVFETLNNRGKGLGPDDLLKNLLFYKAYKDKKTYDEIDDKWRILTNILEEDNIKLIIPTRTEFLKKYLRIIGKEENRDSEILSIFKELVNSENTQMNALDLLIDLIKVANIYSNITRKSDIHYRILTEVLDFKLGYDLIASLLYKLGYDIYNQEKDRILSYITAFFIVFNISSKTKYLSNLIPTICTEIATSSSENTISIFTKRLEEEIKKLREDFRSKLLSTRFTGRKSKKNATILLQIANYYLEGNTVERPTLEHIMPRRHDSTCGDYSINDEIKKDQIGNLTLITGEDNSSANNKCFKHKIKVYETSSLYITRSIYQDLPTGNTDRERYREKFHSGKENGLYKSFAENIQGSVVWSEKSIDDRTKGFAELLTFIIVDNSIDSNLYKIIV